MPRTIEIAALGGRFWECSSVAAWLSAVSSATYANGTYVPSQSMTVYMMVPDSTLGCQRQ